MLRPLVDDEKPLALSEADSVGERLVVRPSMASMLMLFSWLGLLLVLTLLVAIKNKDSDSWVMVALISVLIGWGVWWFMSHRVDVCGGYLHYHSPLFRHRSIAIRDLRAHMEVGKIRQEDWFRPFVRLVIRSSERGAKPKFDINLKVFRKDDVKALIRLLTSAGVMKRW